MEAIEDTKWADSNLIDAFLQLIQQQAIPNNVICLHTDFYPSISKKKSIPLQTPGLNKFNPNLNKNFY